MAKRCEEKGWGGGNGKERQSPPQKEKKKKKRRAPMSEREGMEHKISTVMNVKPPIRWVAPRVLLGEA
jgi:hypothetical protein